MPCFPLWPAPSSSTSMSERISSLSRGGPPRRTISPLSRMLGPGCSVCSALFGGLERRPSNDRNMAPLIFLDPEIRELFCAGGGEGSGLVGALRVRYEQRRPDPRVQALISELKERSPLFRQLWQERGVVKRMKGRKTFDHPEVGRIELDWDRLTVPGAGGQVLMVYSAEPGTPAATALTLLATLAATAAQPG